MTGIHTKQSVPPEKTRVPGAHPRVKKRTETALRFLVVGCIVIGVGALNVPGAEAQAIFWPGPEPSDPVEPPDVDFFAAQLSAMETSIGGYLGGIRDIARGLLWLMIALEIAVSGAMWGLSRTGMDEMIYRLGVKILVWGVVFLIITDTGVPSGILNMQSIPNGFRAIAYSLFGSPTGWPTNVYPGDLLELGMIEGARIMSAGLLAGWWFTTFIGLMAAVAALVTLGAFVLIAIRLWIAIINTIIATLVGLIMIGFAGWRGTASLADRYIIWVFHASIHLFFVDALIYLGGPVVSAMFSAAVAGNLLDTILGLMMWPVIAGTYLGMVLYIPRTAARVITEGASTGLQNAIGM
jgi:type IV secretory pathway TrbL component